VDTSVLLYSPLPAVLKRCFTWASPLDGFPVKKGETRQGKAQDRTFRSPLPALLMDWQLAAIALGGSTQHPRAVFFGSVAALLLASSIGVLAGGEIAGFLPAKVLKGLAALGFAVLAVRLLWPEE
jgi:hypothetical protein